MKDQFRMQHYLRSSVSANATPLVAWSFQSHYIWKNVLTYSWSEIDGWWCLFAEYSDGLFMPLPPLGPNHATGHPMKNSLKKILEQVMTFMDKQNNGTKVTRIENIPRELTNVFESLGFSLTTKDSDYLYRTMDLVQLKGNAYKSQRAACNRFVRTHRHRMVPYRSLDRDSCLALLDRWIHQKDEEPLAREGADADVARLMLRDAERAHRIALHDYQELGLTGRVVWVDGSIKAYTFGYPRSRDVFCVLLEVADRSVTGLAQFVFKEFCRECRQYPFTNTMDDSGLPSLARAKHAYRPCQLVPNYIAHPT